MVKPVSNQQAMALLGGTFDPVHIGHLRIAIRLRELGFAQVSMIPNRVPPHRIQPGASAADRLAMLDAAIAGLDGINTNSLELEREQPSYTADTLRELREQYPQRPLTWVMGNDAWNGFEHWHQPETVLECANILIISRPGEQASNTGWLGEQISKRSCKPAALLTSLYGSICHINWPELDISASDLRAAIKQGDNIAFLTPETVRDYIQQHQLYQ